MRRFQHIGTSRREGATSQAVGAAVAVTQGTGGNAVATVTSSEMVATDFEENVVRISSPSKALTISAWYRGVELRMKTMGQLVPQYQKKNRPDDGGNYVQYNYGRAGVINYKLQVRPNPIMTATTFWQQVEYLRIMTGNALVYIERDGSGEAFDVRNLWLCNGGVYNEQTGTYDLWYLSDRGQRFVPDIDREDVLHFANTFKFPGTIWGIPTLTFAIQTLSLQATNNRQAMENAAKGGRVKLLIGEEKPASAAGTLAFGMFDKGQMDKYAREVNEKIYHQDVVALRGLDKVQQISMTAQEMQLLEQLGFGVAEVGRFLGIHLSLLMEYSNSSYKTPEEATQELMQRTIQPQIPEIEDELNAKLLTPFDFSQRRFHVCEQPLLRLDMKSQADIDLKRLQTGWSPNEIRGQYDMPAVKGGDDHYVSTNLAVAGSKKLSGEEGGNPEPGGSQGDDGAAPAATQTPPQPNQEGGEE